MGNGSLTLFSLFIATEIFLIMTIYYFQYYCTVAAVCLAAEDFLCDFEAFLHGTSDCGTAQPCLHVCGADDDGNAVDSV